MAKVIGPLYSQQASGAFGDVVFLRRGGQNVARIRTTPANPQSPLQVAARTNLGGLSKAYSYAGGDATTPAGTVTLNQVDRSVSPPAITDVSFDYLTQAEADTWDDMQDFVGHNADRLSRNLLPIRTKPA